MERLYALILSDGRFLQRGVARRSDDVRQATSSPTNRVPEATMRRPPFGRTTLRTRGARCLIDASLRRNCHCWRMRAMRATEMLRHALVGLTLVSSSVVGATTAEPSLPLLGLWAARLDVASHPTLLWLKVTETPAHEYIASLRLSPAPEGASQLTTVKVTTRGASWTLRAGEAPNDLLLDVRRSGGGFMATYTVGTSTGRTQLRRVSQDGVLNSRLRGTYVLKSGENIYIRTSSYGPDKVLSYLEERTGRSGFLYQTSPHSYVGGPSYALPDPVEVQATFRDHARLLWRSGRKNGQMAEKSPAYRTEDIQIPAEGAVLACEVLAPAGEGKHPGVVLVPGSGSINRSAGYYVLADVFARHGVASLVCDKRGTGSSTGDWQPQSFREQAQDIVAGMRYLRSRSDVEPRRVGIWAISQGTYPAPIAAVTGDAAFLILVSGYAISLREAVMITNVERLRHEGISDAEIGRYKHYFGRWQQAVMDNDFSALEEVYREYDDASRLPRKPQSERAFNSQPNRARLMWPYQPGPTLRKIKMPVLAFWGARDSEVLPSVHKPVFEQALREAGNTDYDLRIIADADHTLWTEGPAIERIGYAPEYIAGMLKWLRTTVTGADRN